MKSIKNNAVYIIALILTMPISAIELTNEPEWELRTTENAFDRLTTARVTVRGTPYKSASLIARCTNGTHLDLYMAFEYLNLTNPRTYYDSTISRHRTLYGKYDIRRRMTLESGRSVVEHLAVSEGDSRRSLFMEGDQGDIGAHMVLLMATKSFILRFPYYNVGVVDIDWPMEGATEAIWGVLEACPAEKKSRYRKPEGSAATVEEAIDKCHEWNKSARRASRCVNRIKYNPDTGITTF